MNIPDRTTPPLAPSIYGTNEQPIPCDADLDIRKAVGEHPGDLNRLIESARHHKVTDDEREQQRQSFADGNVALSRPESPVLFTNAAENRRAMDRAIAQRCLNWTPHREHHDFDEWVDDQGRYVIYRPSSDAGRAFELVEKYRLRLIPGVDGKEWHVVSFSYERGTHIERGEGVSDDLKTAICLTVLKMHNIDPDSLTEGGEKEGE